jgi:hypothetical protein
VSRGALGRFTHNRELTPIDQQRVVRMNRDTLYSAAVFDLAAGPVTITLPDPGNRFMSMQLIDEDQYANKVVYGAGRYRFSAGDIVTRYALAAIRILINPTDPADAANVHALQDAIRVEQASIGRFEVPQWDATSQTRVREALSSLAGAIDSHRMFGRREDVDPVRHLIGSATAWGGNPEKDAKYFGVTPSQNDGVTVHELILKDVPVDGFWSVSVYNEKGYFEANAANAYSINSVTAKTRADGSTRIQFGGCGVGTENCLPIVLGWNYLVRLYRPRADILSGAWALPDATPVPAGDTSR